MKVLFTFYVPSGGVETLNRLRCKALKPAGVEGHLLYTSSGAGLQNISNIPVTVAPSDYELYMLLKKNRYDAIITTSAYLEIQRLRQLDYDGPILFEAQGLGTYQQSDTTLREAAPILKAHCKAALMPPTPYLVRLMSSICPWLPRYIFPNIIDTKQFAYRQGKKPPHPIIAWVGRLEANKNWELFLQIAHHLIQNRPHLSLWVFLDDKLSTDEAKNAFWQQVHQLGLFNHIKIFPNAPHHTMPDYFSRVGDSGGFLMSTSILEGFGYAVAEAISCYCPVLSTDSEGVRFFIKHNETGKFFTNDDIQDGVRQAVELIDHHALRERIRKQGYAYIKDLMSPAQYANNFIKMLTAIKK